MLTLAGINLVIMVNVAVVVETVFAWPGIGRLLYEGITFRDFPVVQGVVILGGAMIVDRQPAGRHSLRGDRPAHPTGELSAMSHHPRRYHPPSVADRPLRARSAVSGWAISR